MVVLRVVLILILFTGFAFAADEEDMGISDFVEKGMVYYSKGDVDKAVEQFNEALKLNPQDHVAYFQRAKAYEQKKCMDCAISDYSEVIRKKCPGHTLCQQAFYGRAVLYQKRGMPSEAIADYTTIIDSNYDNNGFMANTYNNRALALDRTGKFHAAISDYNKALELMPGLINGYFNRGVTYANMGIYPLALQDFDKELELNSRSVSTMRYKSALMYYNQKDFIKSWYQLFLLMQSGERVSRTLVKDVKKLRPALQSKAGSLKTY